MPFQNGKVNPCCFKMGRSLLAGYARGCASGHTASRPGSRLWNRPRRPWMCPTQSGAWRNPRASAQTETVPPFSMMSKNPRKMMQRYCLILPRSLTRSTCEQGLGRCPLPRLDSVYGILWCHVDMFISMKCLCNILKRAGYIIGI